MSKQQIQKKIGLRIQQFRQDMGLTQEELAKAIGKKRPAIQRLESGSVNPTIFFLREVAGGLKITLEELLQGLNT